MTQDLLARAAAEHAQRPAVQGADATWTYAELDQRATDLAGRLAGMGVGRGGCFAMALPGSALQVALVHAALRAGAVLVPLDARLPPAELLARCQLAGARLLLSDVPLAGAGGSGVQVRGVLQMLRVKPGRLPMFVRLAEEVQALVFTSGTTGKARAAMLTHGNQLASAAASARHLRTTHEDRWLACVPTFHVGGLSVVFRAAHDGSALEVLPRPDPGLAAAALDRGATLASMVPLLLQRVLDARGDKPMPASLRGVLLGGDRAPEALLERCRALGVPVLPTYGCTEACSQVATAVPGEPLPQGAVGRPLPDLKVLVVDAQGHSTPPGQEGELVVRGPIVARGYYDDPGATAERFRVDGFHTGDLGFFDAQGFLHVTGRRGDRIRTRGEWVDPTHVEDALRAHPAVADACVVGMPHAEWGEEVAAAVVLRSPAELRELEAHCRGRLAGFQVPRRFAVVRELPRNASGKVPRGDVRALLGT